MPPEQRARENIDKQLQQASWIVQDYKAINPSAGLGIAVGEYLTESDFKECQAYAVYRKANKVVNND